MGTGSTHIALFVVGLRRPLPGEVRQAPVHHIAHDGALLVQDMPVELQDGAGDGLGHVQLCGVAAVPLLDPLGDLEVILANR